MAESKPNDLSNDLESQFESVKSFESLSSTIALGTAVVRSLQNSGHEAYFAGGFGRDLLIGDTPKDVDIATSASPEAIMTIELKQQFPNLKLAYVQAAEAYPIVIARQGDLEIGIASFRRDVYHQMNDSKKTRRPNEIALDVTMIEDASRRDLTVNALYFDPLTFQLHDPTDQGIADVEDQLIRFVSDPVERIREDRVRLIRAVRFKNRFDFAYHPETQKALTSLKEELLAVSPDRLREELTKMLTLKNRSNALQDLDDLNFLELLLPELTTGKNIEQPAEFHTEGNVFTHQLLVMVHLPEKPTEQLIWAALLHDIGKTITQKFDQQKGRITFDGHEQKSADLAKIVLRRFQFAGDDIEAIIWLVANHMKIRDFLKMSRSKQLKLAMPELFNPKIKRDNLATDLLALLYADNQASLRPDGEPDQSDFSLIKTEIIKLQQEVREQGKTVSVKETFGLDGKFFIQKFQINKDQLHYLGRLIDYLNEKFQDNPSLDRETILNFAEEWWDNLKKL